GRNATKRLSARFKKRAAERKGNRSTRAATRVTRQENRASAPALRWRRARTLATAALLHAGLRIGGGPARTSRPGTPRRWVAPRGRKARSTTRSNIRAGRTIK